MNNRLSFMMVHISLIFFIFMLNLINCLDQTGIHEFRTIFVKKRDRLNIEEHIDMESYFNEVKQSTHINIQWTRGYREIQHSLPDSIIFDDSFPLLSNDVLATNGTYTISADLNNGVFGLYRSTTSWTSAGAYFLIIKILDKKKIIDKKIVRNNIIIIDNKISINVQKDASVDQGEIEYECEIEISALPNFQKIFTIVLEEGTKSSIPKINDFGYANEHNPGGAKLYRLSMIHYIVPVVALTDGAFICRTNVNTDRFEKITSEAPITFQYAIKKKKLDEHVRIAKDLRENTYNITCLGFHGNPKPFYRFFLNDIELFSPEKKRPWMEFILPVWLERNVRMTGTCLVTNYLGSVEHTRIFYGRIYSIYHRETISSVAAHHNIFSEFNLENPEVIENRIYGSIVALLVVLGFCIASLFYTCINMLRILRTNKAMLHQVQERPNVEFDQLEDGKLYMDDSNKNFNNSAIIEKFTKLQSAVRTNFSRLTLPWFKNDNVMKVHPNTHHTVSSKEKLEVASDLDPTIQSNQMSIDEIQRSNFVIEE
ncbi:hypothetical protein SNEBB_007250 [Seison nebaliae]|nr:hypothetical protein SNEBB_007250 [Seison nebaliae]